MFSAKNLLAFVCLGLAYAAPQRANFRVHEQVAAAPQGYTSVGPAPATQTVSLRIALAQNDAGGLVDALYSVSDPKSAKYGQHLSKAQVRMLDRPLCDSC